MGYEKELETARRLALQAAQIALRHREKGLTTEIKADLSPVTLADRDCERLIAAALDQAFPEDGLVGEEGALKASRSGRRWIIDPIDGTVDYIRRIPTWSVLIALEDQQGVAAGVCHLAEQQQMYFAARSAGAFMNEEKLRASAASDPAQALLCVNGLHLVSALPWAERLLRLIAGFHAVRSFGGCQDAMLVVSGRADAWIEPHAREWDLAPLKIIAEEAGAVFFNFNGEGSIYGGNCVIAAPGLAATLRAWLSDLQAEVRASA